MGYAARVHRAIPRLLAVLLAAAPASAGDRTVNVRLFEADVREVVPWLAEKAGLQAVMTDAVQGRVTLSLRRARPLVALQAVLRLQHLRAIRQDRFLLVMTHAELMRRHERAGGHTGRPPEVTPRRAEPPARSPPGG